MNVPVLFLLKKNLWILTISMVFLCTPVRSEYYVTYTGADLLKFCSGNGLDGRPHPRAIDGCVSYISGTMDLYGKLRGFDVISDERFIADYCLPEGGVSTDKIHRAVFGYLLSQEEPRLSSDFGAVFVLLALSEKWPCS